MAPALPQIILHWLSGPWRLMLGTPAAGGTWVFCSNGVCVCVTVCLSCGSSMPRPPPPHTLLCPSALRIETLASCVCVCVRTACVCDSCDPPYVVLSISNLRLSGGGDDGGAGGQPPVGLFTQPLPYNNGPLSVSTPVPSP